MLAFLLPAILCSLCWGPAARGQYSSVTPKRLVERFDFEDINDQGVKLGRGLTLPPAWYPIGRAPQSKDPNFDRLPLHRRLMRQPGFPLHHRVGYSAAGQAAAGEYCLHLQINGGNAGAYLAVGALPAVPGSDYLVTAMVRTSVLEHAAARLRAYFVDPAGNRIETSLRMTPRLRTAGRWTAVDLTLPGEYADVAYLGIEVELVQPTSDPQSLLGNQQIVLEDVAGEAWFDDVAVWQLPHVEISTADAANVTRDPRGPFWNVAVRDLVGGRLTARLTIYDHQMAVVAQDHRPMGWGSPSSWRWSPRLPRYGWYLAELAVLEGAAVHRRVETKTNTITFGATPTLSLGDPIKARMPIPVSPKTKAGLAAGNATASLDEGDPAADADPAGENASADDRVIARTYNAALWLPPGGGPVGQDAERFALVASGAAPRELQVLPELARAAGLGSVVVSAWDRETTLGGFDLRLETLRTAISELKNAGRRVEMSFYPVPEELEHTRGVNSRVPESVLAGDQDKWMPYVQPILLRHGQRIEAWHLGAAETAEAAYTPRLPEVVERIYDAFRYWTPKPRMVLPWQIDQPRRDDLGGLPVGYVVDWPDGVVPDRLDEAFGDPVGWAGPDAERRLQVRPTRADAVPHAARIADLALRMVLAWEQDATGVALPGLWTPGLERRPSLLPDPLLGVAANVADRLSGHRAVGRLQLGDDRVAIIFQPHSGDKSDQERGSAYSDLGGGFSLDPAAYRPRRGMLVAWNRNAPAASLDLYLGEDPVAYDVWGNATPLPLGEDGKHHLPLTDTPVFITGIDHQLALFRSGFSISEPFITSTQTPHQRSLRVTNPWPITISGYFTITGPEQWAVRPQRHAFSLAPGATTDLPIALKFPINELAGAKRLTAEFVFTADQRYDVELSTPLSLGLEGIRFEASLAINPGSGGGVDAQATCIVTNTGEQPISLNVFAKLPGYSRQERLIPRLEPGQSVIRKFRFADAAAALSQANIRLGARETNGPAILNKMVGISDVE